jgi:hypothetical protein
MATEFVLGTTITIKLELKDENNNPVDPTKITMVIAQGAGNFITKHYSVEIQDLRRVGQGIYELDFTTRIATTHTVTSMIKSSNGNQDTRLLQFSVIGINEQARKELAKL